MTLVSLLLLVYVANSFAWKHSSLMRMMATQSSTSIPTAPKIDNNKAKISHLKLKILAQSAACDRGFASTPSERETIKSLVQELSVLNPNKKATANFAPNNVPNQSTPLAGIWRMVYTTAYGSNLTFIYIIAFK